MLSIERIADVPQDLIWRMGVEKYHAMIEAGILTDDDPVELLEGWLVFKMPKNPPHRAATRLIRSALEQILPDGWYVDSQEPITLIDSEPEPNVVVVRGETRQYLDRHPGPADVVLVIEVSDTTLQRDRSAKKRAYARSGIPVYWIVNLSESQIEVYTNPVQAQADYLQRRDYQISEYLQVEIKGKEVGKVEISTLFP
ncbi:MAG: Uma2 family endonuclease [Leptolyngbyaceae cyanobacterium MO_188.B28]|nr:Uma2 family endonuclease [Leptolyngbyaceae cyanobacterium MO_188.B28]